MDTESLASELAASGLDVLQSFRSGWYNEYIRSRGLATDSHHVGGLAFSLAPLPEFEREGGSLALLIGNSKAMWPLMLDWLRGKGGALSDPVDTYAAEMIGKAVASFAGEARYDIFWAADMSPARLVDMNRAALVCGLCYFSEEMFLSVHPTCARLTQAQDWVGTASVSECIAPFNRMVGQCIAASLPRFVKESWMHQCVGSPIGPWVAFRAVVVLDIPATHLKGPPAHVPSPLSDDETDAARAAFAEAMEASSEANLTCDGMSKDLALKWARMRDCVSLGREFKYSDLQSEYHYTKNSDLLARAMAEESNKPS